MGVCVDIGVFALEVWPALSTPTIVVAIVPTVLAHAGWLIRLHGVNRSQLFVVQDSYDIDTSNTTPLGAGPFVHLGPWAFLSARAHCVR